MKKNYTQRLSKLESRRFDPQLQRSILSKSYTDFRNGKSVKYALESMHEIDAAYTKNTYLASDNVRSALATGLSKKGIFVEYRLQGSVETNTHIKLHSDIDVLVFTDKFHIVEPPITVSNYYKGDPLADLRELRVECFNVLHSIYKEVDNSNSKCIQVFPTNPKRKVDVVPSNWINTNEYIQTNREIHRGVHVYNKDEHSRQKDFPFLHIFNINEKDKHTIGSVKDLIRLLKTLKADSDTEIKLSSFEISSIVYDMPNYSLIKPSNNKLLLLEEASSHLDKLINDNYYRENLISPNGKERVFGSDTSKISALKNLKVEIVDLQEDIMEELSGQYRNIKESIIYL